MPQHCRLVTSGIEVSMCRRGVEQPSLGPTAMANRWREQPFGRLSCQFPTTQSSAMMALAWLMRLKESDSLGDSAIKRTMGSVLLPRNKSHRSDQSSRTPSRLLTRSAFKRDGHFQNKMAPMDDIVEGIHKCASLQDLAVEAGLSVVRSLIGSGPSGQALERSRQSCRV